MTDPQHLIRQFLEDRDLSDEECALLVSALRESPELLQVLSGQLLVEELLSQHLAVDRKDFLAQVRQRVRDYQRGEQELFHEAAELRQLALKQLEEAAPKRPIWKSSMVWSALSAALLLCICGAFLSLQSDPHPIAMIQEAGPGVFLLRGGQDVTLGREILPGDRLSTAKNARLKAVFPDGTDVTLEGGAIAAFDLSTTTRAKLVELIHGRLTAEIAPQPAGRPMIFLTRVAQAEVLGTKLELKADLAGARLDVAQGQVRITRRSGGQPQIVEAGRYALVDHKSLTVGLIRWPLHRDGLLFLLEPATLTAKRQNPQTNKLEESALTPHGEVSIDEQERALRFYGGVVEIGDAGQVVAAQCRRSHQLTVELVLAPAEQQQAAPAKVFSFANGQGYNFWLAQDGRWLVLRLNAQSPFGPENTTGGDFQPMDVRLCELEFDQPQHVVVTYRSGELVCYKDGRKMYEALHWTGDFRRWLVHPLVFGGDAQTTWEGRLFGAAVYHRAFSEEEAVAHSEWLP